MLSWGTPELKSRNCPRRLKVFRIFTSSPTPIWNTPVLVPVLPGLAPPNSSTDFSLKCPNPPPKLSQGESPLEGNKLARMEGVIKYEPYPSGMTFRLKCKSSSGLNTKGTSKVSAANPPVQIRWP